MKKILFLIVILILATPSLVYAQRAGIGGKDGPYTATSCDASQYYALGKLCIDSSGKLWKGTGSGVVDVALGNDAWKKHIHTVVFPNGALNYSVSGTTVTVDMAAGYIIDWDSNYITVPELNSTALANTKCLYLDISTPASPVWSAASNITSLKNTSTKIPILVNMLGKLYSPIPTVQSMIKTDPVFKYHTNVAIYPNPGSGTGKVTIESIVGNVVTFSMANGIMANGNGSPVAIAAIASQALDNGQCMYVDISTIATPVWTFATSTSAKKNDPFKIIGIINSSGKLYSPIASMQAALDAAYAAYIDPGNVSYTTVNVAASDGDYTTITGAFGGITGNSANNQYNVQVQPGTYSEVGQNSNGLELMEGVNLKGAGRDQVFIVGPAADDNQEHTKGVIHYPNSCTVEGMTLLAYRNKYAIHADKTTPVDLNFTAKHLITKHYGGQDNYNYDLGLGLYPGQKMYFEDILMLGQGTFIHGPATGRSANNPWTAEFRGCKMHEFSIKDFLEYTTNILLIDGCEIDVLKIQLDPTYYAANPTDPLYNQGYYHRSIYPDIRGSKIGRVDYADATTLTILGQRIVVPGLNARVVNKNAGTISAGKAVILLAEPGVPNAYPTTDQAYANVDIWSGTGIFYGFAEEDIATASNGVVQTSGRPKAFADATGTAILYGDALELDANGSVIKKSTGETVAYALEAKDSGTGLIKVRMK